MRQMSLPASQQLQHKDKSAHTHRSNGYSSDLADAKQEVTELLERLQELVSVVSASLAFAEDYFLHKITQQNRSAQGTPNVPYWGTRHMMFAQMTPLFLQCI